MNVFANIWKHPRTTVTGVLISVTTVAGVLSQHGLTLGPAGNGTVVTLVGAVASALLGLVARDPGTAATQQTSATAEAGSTTSKLGAWALIALLLPAPFVSGCSGQKIAQQIVNWTPALQSAVATVDSAAAMMAPADAAVFTAATVSFDALSNALAAQAKAYLANPSATVLAQLQQQIVAFEQQANSALLAAAHITNAQSQQHALVVIQAVATIAVTLLALVQSAAGSAGAAQATAQASIKLDQVEPLIDRKAAAVLLAQHYDEPVAVASAQMDAAQTELVRAGF